MASDPPEYPPRRRSDTPAARTVDLVYSEADMAEHLQRWEQAQKERDYATQLTLLTGQLGALNKQFQAIPGQIEDIARRVVLQVLAEQRTQGHQRLLIRADYIERAVQTVTAAGVLFLAAKTAHLL